MLNPTEIRRRHLARIRRRASVTRELPTLSAAEAGTLREEKRNLCPLDSLDKLPVTEYLVFRFRRTNSPA